jgi:hypothetical protein
MKLISIDNVVHNTLLTLVSAITKKYENISEITGENFNVFRILKLSTNEVQTHSAFLCELLNPKGSHGHQNLFLSLFIDLQRFRFGKQSKFIDRFNSFDTLSAKVTTESHIGFINEEKSEGGRIDLLIQDRNCNAIIIENKIHASDKLKQLVRYNNAYKNAPIFYLTLNGSLPSVESKGELKEGDNYVCISYAEDIITWLELCRKEAVIHAILRETITQYIYLLKHLTNQTINERMKKELVDEITESANKIDAAFEIVSSFDEVKLRIVDKYKETLLTSLGKEWDTDTKGKFGKKDSELRLYKDAWSHAIILTFNSDYQNLELGIYRKDDEKCTDSVLQTKVREKLKDLNIGSVLNYPNWVWNCKFQDWGDISWGDKFNGVMTIKTNETIETILRLLVKEEL